MRGWDGSKHPRDQRGKFAVKPGTDRWISQIASKVGRDRGDRTPLQVPPAQFNEMFPEGRRLYRGVGSPANAAYSRMGGLGGGDFGKGIYLGENIATAQGYINSRGGREDGVMLRAGILPGAKVRRVPDYVLFSGSGGSAATDRWAEENGIDVVVTNGGYRIVKNPAVLVFDSRDYTLDETVVLDFQAGGYTVYDEYLPLQEQLRKEGVL